MRLGEKELSALEGLPSLPPLELASAWRTVQGFFTSTVKHSLELTLPHAKGFKQLQNDVVWAFASPRPPVKLNAELDGAAFVLMAPVKESEPAIAALVTTWIARGGLPFALQALACAFSTFTNAVRADRWSTAALLVPSDGQPWLPLDVPIDALFRAALARASEGDRHEARDVAAQLRNGPFLGSRSVLSSTFLEQAWLDADLDERVRTGQSTVFGPLSLLRSTDGARVARLLGVLTPLEFGVLAGSQTRGTRAPLPFAHALLERFPDAAPLRAWFKRSAELMRDAEKYARQPFSLALESVAEVAKPIAANENISRAVVDALTTLQNEKFAKAEDPRPALIELLRSVPKTSASLVRQAALRKAKWAVGLADQLERAAEGGAPPPEAGTFWLPESFAPLLSSTDASPLPPSEVAALRRVFRERDAADLRRLAARCTSQSLAAFSWDLFQAWLVAGAPSVGRWALLALGDFGDDDTARRLTPLIREWPGASAHQRAVTGLEVLAAIGSDTALRMLDSIGRRVRFQALQDRARALIGELAARRGLTAQTLSDRLVPDGGLGPDGTRTLSFGTRSFEIAVDARLVPFVTTAGRRVANLPAPRATDDAMLAAQSVEAWKELKTLLKAEGPDLVLRFELAMANERRWSRDEFEQFVLRAPLLTQLVRSLLWGCFDAGGKLVSAFRVSPACSPVTVTGAPLELSADARVGLVHPLLLSEEQSAVLADAFMAEGEAPFEQLTRRVFTLGPREWGLAEVRRYEGRTTSVNRLRGLRSRGWRLGPALDAGFVGWLTRRISDTSVAALNIGGMRIAGEGDRTVGVGTIVFGDELPDELAFDPNDASSRPVDTRSPVAISEVLRDVDTIVDADEA